MGNTAGRADRQQVVEIAHGEQHRFVWLGAGDTKEERGVSSNQYAILDGGEAMLLDPGGYHVFGRVLTNMCALVEPKQIRTAFLSHQDPDVCASIVSWVEVQPDLAVYVSALWERFLPHFALPTAPRVIPIPDAGMAVTLKTGARLRMIPAHGLHSPGNFQVYDEATRVLFTGDLGAALVPENEWSLYVTNFDKHVEYMDGFHRRFFASTKAVKAYLKRVRGLPIDFVCPQHGSIFRGADVPRFFDWLDTLEVGFDHAAWGDPA